MGLEDEAQRHIQRAVTALAAAAAAEKRQKAHELGVLQARNDTTENKYRALIAIGQTEAARQELSLASGHKLPHCLSAVAFFAHMDATLQMDMKRRTYENNAANFWKLLEHLKDEVEHNGATLGLDAFNKDNWSKVGWSKFAEPSTLAFILAPAFEPAFFEALKKTGKTVTDLVDDVTGYVKPKSKGKAPAKKPPAKAPARRPRRRGRRREEEEDDDDFAPPPKAKAQDDCEIETAVSEAALAPAGTKTAEIVDLMADNKMLRRDLAARDEEIAAARAEIAAYKEQIEEKEAESRTYVNIARDAKKELDAVKAELAREKDKNKAVSPLCDSTNIRLTSSAA